ncbi:glycosyltransferase [Pseudomonas knackmussii]|uniref:glycosyltransferase n=1 Tax=Pseudomonas knackmussii TaxID=65741 RepID=UPI00136378D5|nr:glycosyltransferase [Pseudomonas knackmussii]
MRIVLDMQGAQTASRYRGIGRYTLSLTQAIARNRGDHEVILVLSGLFPETIEPIRNAFRDFLPQENIRVWHAPGPVRDIDSQNSTRREVAELIREAFIASLRPDIVHMSSLFEGYADDAVTSVHQYDQFTPVVITLHDLIPLLNPEKYLAHNPAYAAHYRRKLENLAKADGILCISDYSLQEGVSALNLDTKLLFNTSEACDPLFTPGILPKDEQDRIKQLFCISRKVVLYTGGADERKNLSTLIVAYAALDKPLRKSHQLVLVGRLTPHENDHLLHTARSVGLGEDELVLTGFVVDEDLAQLYRLATLFVFPSLHEGFGLPPLEAMSCGTPTIASNTSSIPEVVGWEEALFYPHQATQITAALTRALSDEAFRAELSRRGLAQAQKFSWDTSARRAIAAFEQLHDTASQVDLPSFNGNAHISRLVDAIATKTSSGELSSGDCAAIAAAIAMNHPESDRQRELLVDISELIQRDSGTGIQRVTRAILSDLTDNPPHGYKIRAVYSTPGSRNYRYANSFMRNLEGGTSGHEGDTVIEPQNGDVFLGLDLQPQIVPECRTYYRFLRNQGVQVHFVVYDLLPVLLPGAFPAGSSQAHEQWLEVVAENNGAVCISKAVADEMRDWMARRKLDTSAFSLNWFHLGADIENSLPTKGLPENAESVIAQIRSRPTFLMVGTVEPRKGYRQTMAAFDTLWKQGMDVGLVIVGKQGWEVDVLAKDISDHPEQGRRLLWLSGVSDEYLESIYASVSCLLMASEGEGFGLPLIEAAKHELPIVVRDLPVFREVAGEYAFYFSGDRPEQLSAELQNWLRLHYVGKAPSSRGITYLTWTESVDQLLCAILKGEEHARAKGTQDIAQKTQETAANVPCVLQLAPYPIRKPRHGGQLRAAATRKAFRDAGFSVKEVGFYQAEAYRPDELNEHDVAFPPDSPFRLYQGEHLPALSDFLMAAFSIEDERIFAKVAQSIDTQVNVILVEQPWLYPLARRLKDESPNCRGSIIVYNSHNIEAPMKEQILGKSTESPVARNAVVEMSNLEQAVARGSDVISAVTSEDADVLHGYSSKKVIVAPNGISPWAANSEKVEFWRQRLPEQPWPIFIASAHPPNYTGFVDSVGDALACIPPGSKLVVAGGVGPHLLQELSKSPWGNLNASRLQILGVLDDDDLAAVKSLAHAFLLPIGAGGGSNIKTAEALYSGKPVICTSTALRGFENYRTLPGVWVADTPRDFQQAIRTVLSNADQLSRRPDIHRRLRQKLTWDVSLHPLPQEVLKVLSKRRRLK